MATEGARRNGPTAWPVLAGAVVVAAIGATAYLRWPGQGDVAPPQPPPAAAARTEAPQAEPQRAKPAAPSFDVVRVTPEGTAVIAGRAEPGAQVTVREGEHALGQTQADARGEFVLVPDTKLPPGGRELTLSAREANGREVKGEQSVVVVIPAPTPAPASPAVAVLVPQGAGSSRLLQGPPDRKALSLNTVDYDDKGEIRFSGAAAPSTPLRVYVDNRPVGEATADAEGRWTLTPHDAVAAGVHQFRVDQLAASGRVASRIELPFQRTIAPPAEVSPGHVIVQPGQNLWRIARQTYGAGVRYTVIYLANREQIRDPKRIYPGQVFATPQ